ncbi:MAG: hypothetical protein M3Y93_12075 [Pseudomonadota bacterium]|nr:hypothetical protein [Pseudomonadota bacterium]
MHSGRWGWWAWRLVVACIVALLVAWASSPRVRARIPIPSGPRTLSSRPEVAALRALPPAGAPLLLNRAHLQDYAEEGDAKAASWLFKDIAWCIERPRMQAWLTDLQSDPLWNQSAKAYFHARGFDDPAIQQKALASIERNAQRVQDTQRMCDGTSAMLSDGSIYLAMLLAARLGDSAASACALVAPYRGPNLTPGQATAYADETHRYAEAAVQKGSWANVSALATASSRLLSDGADAGYGDYANRPDMAMQLRYWALMRHGIADGTADARTFDGGIATMSASVTPAQRNEALRWADETYAKYFALSGPIRLDMALCDY